MQLTGCRLVFSWYFFLWQCRKGTGLSQEAAYPVTLAKFLLSVAVSPLCMLRDFCLGVL
jgi:hypothetical protein